MKIFILKIIIDFRKNRIFKIVKIVIDHDPWAVTHGWSMLRSGPKSQPTKPCQQGDRGESKMHLKKPLWSESSPTPESDQKPPCAAMDVGEMVVSLNKQRLYREVTLALQTGLKEARAEFSFLRVRGLRSILKFLRSVAESDSTINLFCHSQSIPELQGLDFFFKKIDLFVVFCCVIWFRVRKM